MSESNKLSVRYGWSPLGESMPSVLHIVQHLNQLKAPQIRSRFAKKHNLLNSGGSLMALRPEYFQFDKIMASTGWCEEEISASFPNFMLGFSNRLVNRDLDNVLSINETLRVCKLCFAKSCHLMLHQLDEWSLCPIHKSPLTTLCPKCGETLGKYRVDLDLRTAFKCLSCKHRLVNRRFEYDPKLGRKKRKILLEYSQWCSQVKNVLSGTDRRKYLFVSQPEHYSQISAYYKLLGGPSWFRHCLRDCSEGLKYHRRNHKLTAPLSRPSICQRVDKKCLVEYYRSEQLHLRSSTFEERLGKRLLADFSAVEKQILNTFPWISECTLAPDRVTRGNLSFSLKGKEGTAQALEIMRDEVVNHLASPNVPHYSSLFWNYWKLGPGDLLLVSQKKNGEMIVKNSRWVTEASSLWFKSVLRSIYSYLLLHSYLYDSDNPEIFESGLLLKVALEPAIFGSGSIYAATETNLVELSSIASLNKFGNIISEKLDNNRSRPNKRFVRELFKLVTCHKKHRTILEECCYQIAQINQTRESQILNALRNARPC